MLAQDVLEGLGYRVLLARDGAEAVETFGAAPEPIDLVVLDAVMPRLGGREAQKQIRSSGSAVPVLFMTGHTMEHVQGEPAEEPGVWLIQKPFSVTLLGCKVREILDQSRKR